MRLFTLAVAVVVMALTLTVRASGNLDAAHNVGFHVPPAATAVSLEAVDGDNIVWGSVAIPVTGAYMEVALDGLKAQFPLSGYPDLTLRLTIVDGQPGCECIGDDSTVTILD